MGESESTTYRYARPIHLLPTSRFRLRWPFLLSYFSLRHRQNLAKAGKPALPGPISPLFLARRAVIGWLFCPTVIPKQEPCRGYRQGSCFGMTHVVCIFFTRLREGPEQTQ